MMIITLHYITVYDIIHEAADREERARREAEAEAEAADREEKARREADNNVIKLHII